ncbi:MAG TPA: SDR family oxidoreductase [Xanthobacteraceae bacterium]|nr:SDR family oxidoreductase [Xanthobacteraceae bacterium]
MTSLTGKAVLIVGGSSGIGLAAAKAAAQAGAKVTIAARTKDRLDKAASEIGLGVVARTIDTSNDESVDEFFKNSVWDHVVASAGAGGRGKLPDMKIADAQAVMNIKYWGYFRIGRAAKISPTGSLTFIGGKLAGRPTPGTALIASVNSAIEGLTRGLAVDLAPTRVNTVSPGVIDTPLWDQMSPAAREAMYKKASETLPARRIGQPEDVAQALIFLMTNPFATGMVMNLEGGALLI